MLSEPTRSWSSPLDGRTSGRMTWSS